MFIRTTIAGTLAALTPTTVLAHSGHLGELAGHSHWIGVVALAGAALVAGLVATKGRKTADEDKKTSTDVEADDAVKGAGQ